MSTVHSLISRIIGSLNVLCTIYYINIHKLGINMMKYAHTIQNLEEGKEFLSVSFTQCINSTPRMKKMGKAIKNYVTTYSK